MWSADHTQHPTRAGAWWVIGLRRLIHRVWWGPSGRGGLAGAAWRVKVGIHNHAQASHYGRDTDGVLPTLTGELRVEVDRVVATARESSKDESPRVSHHAKPMARAGT